jgi:hypothetical protein
MRYVFTVNMTKIACECSIFGAFFDARFLKWRKNCEFWGLGR